MFKRPQALLAGVALMLASSGASAQDAIVPDDFMTIQSAVLGAIDMNGNGTVEIFVRAGVYPENVLIQRPNLELSGEAAATTTVQGSGGLDGIRVQDADFVTIQELTISNAGGQSAVELQRSQGCTVQSCVLTMGHDGLTLNNSSGAMISGNEAFGNTFSGIKLARSSSNTVVANDCHDNVGHGIDLAAASMNIVQANTLTANGGNGLRIRLSSGNQLISNVATANVDNGYLLRRSANSNMLLSNTASGNFSNGLRMRTTTGNVITLNSFTGNAEYGVRRRNWTADDFDGGLAGVQDPPGDNDLSGNGKGPLRED